jgi:adenine-specific DNA-methyltransferase
VDSIVLDFFAGPGTTAHAVLDLNVRENSHRKFICVQLPEKIAVKHEAFKAGYKTITDLTKERMRRVCQQFQAQMPPQNGSTLRSLDIGYKWLRLEKSGV